MSGRRSGPLAAMLCLSVGVLPGQQPPEPIVTDRPDQTESSLTVPSGLLQIEAGWSMRSSPGPGPRVRQHAFPETLVRVGVTPRLEGRLGFQGWQRAGGQSGLGDLELGFKYGLHAGSGGGAVIAVMADVALPTGQDGFRGEGIAPSARLAVAHQLSPRLATGYNLGASLYQGPADEMVLEALYSWTLGADLAPRLGAFAEVFGTVAAEPAGTHMLMDGGLTLRLRPNIQADISGGLGLTADADDWFIGAGLSLRMPR